MLITRIFQIGTLITDTSYLQLILVGTMQFQDVKEKEAMVIIFLKIYLHYENNHYKILTTLRFEFTPIIESHECTCFFCHSHNEHSMEM